MTQRYVGKWGSDIDYPTFDGLSWDSAYLTIGKVLIDTDISGGDQINVASGAYNEALDLTPFKDTTLHLLRGAKVTSSGGDATLELGDGWTIKGGGEVEHTGTKSAIEVIAHDDCSLLDITLTSLLGATLSVVLSTDLTIQRCRINGNRYGFYALELTGLRMLDTEITIKDASMDALACVFDGTSIGVQGLIQRGAITCRTSNVDKIAYGLDVLYKNSNVRLVDVIIEGHSGYTAAATSNPTLAVNVGDSAKVTLDGCSLESHADHVDTKVFDIGTDEYSDSIGVLTLTHRTTYDPTKVSGPIITGVVPIREWYAARADIEKVFGIRNVAIWADLDADEDVWKIQQRVEDFCEDTSAEVEDILREAGFKIPLADSSGALPKQFVHWVAILAGVNLYEARGIEEAEDNNNRLLVQRERVMSELAKIVSGRRRTTLVRTGGVTPSAGSLTLATKV